MTHTLGGENLVFWGGREGYASLLNTDLKRELDHMGAWGGGRGGRCWAGRPVLYIKARPLLTHTNQSTADLLFHEPTNTPKTPGGDHRQPPSSTWWWPTRRRSGPPTSSSSSPSPRSPGTYLLTQS